MIEIDDDDLTAMAILLVIFCAGLVLGVLMTNFLL